jgi:predicted nucleic acid-binding Zn ribbon protein
MKPVSQVVPEAIAALLRETPLSPGKVEFAWKATVGPAMERVTKVRFENGVLFVQAQTPAWAREVRRGSSLIRKRLEALLGLEVVQRIVVQ